MRRGFLPIAFGIVALVPSISVAALHLDPALPVPNGPVYALVESGSVLYVGGDFTAIGDSPRQRLAAIDLTTGGLTAWNPGADYAVRALALDGSLLYVGGDFLNVGGAARSSIAAVDVTTGAATAWNPIANGRVNALVVNEGTVYAGGTFTKIGNVTHGYIAAIDAATGAAASWNPGLDRTVNVLVRDGSTLYAGGLFSHLTGYARVGAVSFDLATGAVTAWNPHIQADPYYGSSNGVNALAVANGLVYIGGVFAGFGADSRPFLGAVDATTGSMSSWDPQARSIPFALAVRGGYVYAGGFTGSMGGASREGFAELDRTTGLATALDPTTGGTVRAVVSSPGGVRVGGVSLLSFVDPTVSVEPKTAPPTGLGLRARGLGQDLQVTCVLPATLPARIDVFDAAGRRVLEREVGGEGVGRHDLTLARRGMLPAGVYLLRLTQGERSVGARGVMLR